MSRDPKSEALDAWVLATAPHAIAYATSLLRDRDAAEDIVQDCYCRLLSKANVYDLPRDGLKILLRAVTNACINHQTRRRPVFRLHRDDQDNSRDEPRDPRSTSPDALAMADELDRAIQEGLDRLTDKQRAALQLRSLGHSQQEVAEMLGISVSHAGVLIHRARQAMALFLAPHLDPETMP